MIDWALYNGTGRCFADAYERLYQEANKIAAASGMPEVLELPPGKFTFHRAPVLRPMGVVILHGPSTYFELPYLRDGKSAPQALERTAHGWGVVAPTPKVVN